MRADATVYLDTNIFIFAFENVAQNTALLKQLLATETTRPRFATSELTLSELLVKPFRDANRRMIDAYEAVIMDSPWLKVLPVGRPVLRHAALLRKNYAGLKLPDAIHVSTAFAAECSHMLTADNGLKSSYDITQDDLALPHAALTVIRPDETRRPLPLSSKV